LIWGVDANYLVTPSSFPKHLQLLDNWLYCSVQLYLKPSSDLRPGAKSGTYAAAWRIPLVGARHSLLHTAAFAIARQVKNLPDGTSRREYIHTQIPEGLAQDLVAAFAELDAPDCRTIIEE
jgi:hypothetical protein